MPSKVPRILGITGGVATGKSTLLRAFSEVGFPVCSADEVAAKLFTQDAELQEFLKEEGVWRPEISSCKEGFWEKALQTPDFFDAWLLKIHPKIKEGLLAFIERNAAAAWIVLEIPLLFENRWEGVCSKTLVATCDRALQEARFLGRPGATLEKLHFLERRLFPLNQKELCADFVVHTDQGCDIKENVDFIVKTLRKDTP